MSRIKFKLHLYNYTDKNTDMFIRHRLYLKKKKKTRQEKLKCIAHHENVNNMCSANMFIVIMVTEWFQLLLSSEICPILWMRWLIQISMFRWPVPRVPLPCAWYLPCFNSPTATQESGCYWTDYYWNVRGSESPEADLGNTELQNSFGVCDIEQGGNETQYNMTS